MVWLYRRVEDSVTSFPPHVFIPKWQHVYDGFGHAVALNNNAMVGSCQVSVCHSVWLFIYLLNAKS